MDKNPCRRKHDWVESNYDSFQCKNCLRRITRQQLESMKRLLARRSEVIAQRKLAKAGL